MSFERDHPQKTNFERAIKITTAFALGIAAVIGLEQITNSSDINSTTSAIIARQTESQDILDNGTAYVVYNYQIICGNIDIQDPLVETLKTGNTFYIGIRDNTQNNKNTSFLRLAENMTSCEATVPISAPATSSRVGFNANGQLTNDNGQIIASAYLN